MTQFNALIAAPPVQAVDKEGPVWIEALAARTYETPQYGKVPVTIDKLQRFVDNFKNNVRGQDIATDYEHGMDRSKGTKASGWYRDMKVAPSSHDPNLMSLWTLVDLTGEAKKEVEDNQWKYFSLDWEDQWTDNDGNTWEDVIMGGGLTNRPVAKKMLPINFSEAMWEEVDDEDRKQFAVWSTKYVNDLPDSAFLWVEAGGSKDSEGKTTPRSLRHLPYKDANGKIDLPHLRNAIARIPQMSHGGTQLKSVLQGKARRLLASAGKMSEAGLLDEMSEILNDNEVKEWEHSEPGTGSPPQPRTDEDGSDDIAITEGWRRPSPPPQEWGREGEPSNSVSLPSFTNTAGTTTTTNIPKGGFTNVSEYVFAENQAQELLRVLELPVDAKPDAILESTRRMSGELTTLRASADKDTQEKVFAETYPAYWEEHRQLMERDRENTARNFSESAKIIRRAVGNGLIDTNQGLSAAAQQKVIEYHKKFAEGTATLEDFEECIKTITNGGVVTFGEMGSGTSPDEPPPVDTSTAQGIVQARKTFAEVIAKVQLDNPDWDYDKALNHAADKYPDLAQAYRVTLPA